MSKVNKMSTKSQEKHMLVAVNPSRIKLEKQEQLKEGKSKQTNRLEINKTRQDQTIKKDTKPNKIKPKYTRLN